MCVQNLSDLMKSTTPIAASFAIGLLVSACGGGSSSGPTVSDPPPSFTVSVSDAAVVGEGSEMSFSISLSTTQSQAIDVDYTTRNGSASAGVDYVANSGTVRIPANSAGIDISVSTSDDTIDEPDETIFLDILSASAGTIGTSSASGTISDNDNPPTISIADDSATEGGSGQAMLSFPVSLSGVSGFDITADFATTDVSATAGSDYLSASGFVSIPAGDLTTTVNVQLVGDTIEEPNETFTITLSNPGNASLLNASATGTIINDDTNQMSGLPSRPGNTTCVAPDRPVANAAIATEEAFPSLQSLTKPVGLMQPPGDTSQWFVIEQDGRVLRFDNSPAVSAVSTFIDIRSPGDPIDVDSGSGEAGLLGMAFHPDYGNGNWYVYLSYMIDGAGTGGPFVSVISRFESKDNGLTLDATDATQLLTLDQPFSNHNGGQISFGPDGYLYIHFGDGGSGGDPGDRAQNNNNLFGTILRIDVDSGTPYAIPADNPFFRTGLCDTGSGTSACPEIYAYGLRNAWKWSFDDETGQLWLGDVGQNAWEEIDIIELGGNYGWRCREGAHDFNTSGSCPAGLIDPVIEYSHGVGNSITGGVVYRGSDVPELAGRYLFADYAQGKIFASVADGDGGYTYEQLADTSFLISAFATESDGEVLFLNYGGGDVRRIIQAGGSSTNTIPDLLSATGCVIATDPAQPAGGLIPYDINAPFWSDGAAKQRWYAIPDNASIDVASDGDWLFPTGTVLMKNFRLNNELIETRLFMRHTDGEWGGYTYEWNAAGTDADRVVGGKVAIKDGQSWIYPSGADCMQCHTAAANFSVGIEHGQLNRDFTYPSTGITANQLETADAVDLLTAPLADAPDNLPRFVDPSDSTADLASRARSYLHSNCSGCHRPGGPTPSNMDLRFSTALVDTNTCNVIPVSGFLGDPSRRLVSPGNGSNSMLVVRANRRDSHGMPPLGSAIVDAQGVQLLTDWIDGIGACP